MTTPMPDLDKAAGVIRDRIANGQFWTVDDLAQALSDAGLLLPEGFVAVKREPTEAMIEAGAGKKGVSAYRAMIQAQTDGAKALQDGRDGN